MFLGSKQALLKATPQKSTNAIFLFAHQDDEFGVYEAITKKVSILGASAVWCIYITDGGLKSRQRNLESEGVLTSLGVEKNRIIFMGENLAIPDGKANMFCQIIFDWLSDFLSKLGDDNILYVPAWEGGHPDHDIIHAISVIIMRKYPIAKCVYQYPLYNAKNCRLPFFSALTPLSENGFVIRTKVPILRRLKYVMYCARYPSQILSWIGLFPFVTYKYLMLGEQQVQHVSFSRLLEPPHSGILYYEYRNFSSWVVMEEKIKMLIDATCALDK